MTTATTTAGAPASIEPSPGSRLDALAAAYAQAKPAADAAAARLKEITDAIKVELTTAAPGSTQVDLHSSELERPLRLSARTSWRLDTNRLKAEAPNLYVRFAERRTVWDLRAVR